MPFRYSLSARVSWAMHPFKGAWRITWRRYTEREGLPPIIEYALLAAHEPLGSPHTLAVNWAYEADLQTYEEP